jgi:catechol 2,3-dioxygenase-like lactoylglutathione lyase family enzyme
MMAKHETEIGSPLDAAIIGVDDLDASLAFYRDEIGLSADTIEEWAGDAFERYWRLPAGTRAHAAFLGAGPDPVGRILLLEFDSPDRQQIRSPDMRRAVGLVNLNFYTRDIRADYEYFHGKGYEFWSEPVQHDFGPRVGQPIEVVFNGPDSVAINLVELVTNDPDTLIGEMRWFVDSYGRTETGYTPVVTSAHTVQSMNRAVGFYQGVLDMHVAIDEELSSAESNHFLGLAAGARTHTVFMQGAHMFGKIALAQPLNYECPSMVSAAVAPNIGYVAQSFRVDDIEKARLACTSLDTEIYSELTELDLPGRGPCRTMLVRNPGSGALQEIYQAGSG